MENDVIVQQIKRGDTYKHQFAYTHNVGTEEEPDWQPLPLTGCTARFQLRRVKGDTLAVSVDTTDGITIDEPNGIVTVEVHYSQMELLALGEYKADLELTYPDDYRESTPTYFVVVLEDVSYSE